MMSRPLDPDTRPLLEQLESALDTGCAVLVALEVLRGRANTGTGDDGRVQGQIRQMIRLLRKTISELRAAHEEEHSLLAFGFVLEAGSGQTALALDAVSRSV
jgi:hypothetical protein